jgi:DNA-binding response OmpR family regulator
VTTVTRILIADDDPAIRNACRGILTRAGYVTQAAEDGLAALELVQAGDLPFHLVITDVVMPRMSGVALLDALSLSHPSLPVLLMSGYSLEELRARGIDAPCSVLAKPFTAEALLAEVEFCLHKVA